MARSGILKRENLLENKRGKKRKKVLTNGGGSGSIVKRSATEAKRSGNDESQGFSESELQSDLKNPKKVLDKES